MAILRSLLAIFIAGSLLINRGASVQEGETDAEAVLAAAREAIGGQQRLASVRSFEITRDDGKSTMRVLFPDRWQDETDRRLYSFDGEKFWSRWSPDLSYEPPAPPAPTEELRARFQRNVARYALKYFLQSVPTRPSKSKLIDSAEYCASSEGLCLEFRDMDNVILLRLLLDATTGRPKATITPASNDPDESLLNIREFTSFEVVDGIVLPSIEISRRIYPDGREEVLRKWRHSYRINPPLTVTNFEEQRGRES